jgi:hypothetical protein
VAIGGREAPSNRNFFWIVAFRLILRIRLFRIADDGLPAVVHMFIAAHKRAARAKANCD